MTSREPDEPWQHGSTVLPGVPLPPSAHPHPPADPPPAQPGPEAPPPDGEAVESPPGRHASASPASAPARSPGRGRPGLLLVLSLLVVLAALAAFVWPGFLLQAEEEPAEGQAPRPTASATSVTLGTPGSVAGLRRFTGAADKALAASVAKASVAGLSDPVSAVYGTGTTPKAQVIAWRAVSPPAEDTVTAAFTGYEGSTGAQVTAVREVETAGLGGHMECGLATLKQNKTLQCFWADDASVGSITVLSVTDRAEATSTASAIRAAVEQKG